MNRINTSKPKVKIKIILYVVLLALFWFKGFLYLDPDFGWRLKAGEMYWNIGIPKTDPFSYTMPSFSWVDHAWATSLIFYIVYTYFGYGVLALIMAFLATTSLYISSRSLEKSFFPRDFFKNAEFSLGGRFFPRFLIQVDFEKLYFFANLSFILAGSVLFTFFGVRAQVVSWFMFSILFYFLSNESILGKAKIFLPAFFNPKAILQAIVVFPQSILVPIKAMIGIFLLFFIFGKE